MSNLRRKLEKDARDLDMKVWLENREEEDDSPKRREREDSQNREIHNYSMSFHTEL